MNKVKKFMTSSSSHFPYKVGLSSTFVWDRGIPKRLSSGKTQMARLSIFLFQSVWADSRAKLLVNLPNPKTITFLSFKCCTSCQTRGDMSGIAKLLTTSSKKWSIVADKVKRKHMIIQLIYCPSWSNRKLIRGTTIWLGPTFSLSSLQEWKQFRFLALTLFTTCKDIQSTKASCLPRFCQRLKRLKPIWLRIYHMRQFKPLNICKCVIMNLWELNHPRRSAQIRLSLRTLK